MDPDQLTNSLLAAAEITAIWRMTRIRLFTVFPLLLSWLVLSGTESVLLSLFSKNSHAYFWIYFTLEPSTWVAAVASAGELLALTFQAYPGIRTVGRWAVYGGIVLGSAAYATMASLFHRASTRGSHPLLYLQTSDRAMLLGVAIVILVIRFVISRYPIRLSFDVEISSTFLCVVFLSEAARLLIDSLMPLMYNNYVDWTQDVLRAAATFVWAFLLRRAEKPDSAPRPQAPVSEREEHLLKQLDAINEMLSRVGRAAPPATRAEVR